MSGTDRTSSKKKYPYTTCIVSEGRRKFHTTMSEQGEELVEEYDLKTNELLVRKTRKPTVLGRETPWEYEIGVPQKVINTESQLITPSSKNAFQWRIRNCFWPKSVYSVEIDAEEQEIVVRTSNKKYFKRFSIPDLRRLNEPLNKSFLSWTHENNTLIITYRKPNIVLAMEREKKKQLIDMGKQQPNPREGDVQCPQQ